MCFFFFKQKTAYEMRISDWSSDVCSSDLPAVASAAGQCRSAYPSHRGRTYRALPAHPQSGRTRCELRFRPRRLSFRGLCGRARLPAEPERRACLARSEEHTSELQSLMRTSYADFRLKNKKKTYQTSI